jgi:hypothetical protein
MSALRRVAIGRTADGIPDHLLAQVLAGLRGKRGMTSNMENGAGSAAS